MSYRKERKKKLALIYVFGTLIILITIAVFVALLRSDKEKLRDEGIEEYKAGRYDKAIELFKESLDENQLFSKKMDLDTRMYLGTAQMKTGRYMDAEKTFIRLHKDNDGTLDDARIDMFLGLAQVMQGYGDMSPDTVIPKYEEAVKYGNYTALLYLASSYYEKERYEDMVQAYEDYITHVGLNSYVAYQLSSYYLSTGDYEKALAYVNDGLESGDDLYEGDLRYNLAVIYEKDHDYDNAYQIIKELYKSFPDNEEYRAEYDYLYTRVNIDPNPVHVIEEEEEE